MIEKLREKITLASEMASIVSAFPVVGSGIVFLSSQSTIALYLCFGFFAIGAVARIIASRVAARQSALAQRAQDEHHDLCSTISLQYYNFMRTLSAGKAKMAFSMESGLYVQHPGELVDDTVRVLEEAVEALSNLLTRWTGRTVCACVKLVELDNEGSGPYDGVVSTWARSVNSGHSRLLATDENEIRVSQNTDFKKILGFNSDGRIQGPFYCGNLIEYAKRMEAAGEKYENSTSNWQRKYRATIVVPICADRMSLASSHTGERAGEVQPIVGFLCVDTMSELAFPDEMEVPYVNLMTTFADGLYTVIAKYKDCENRVQSASR
ncbi:hypothetical protein H6A35_05560 [Collinsella tanakaei]|nr:hypothetical protein [Collinsella tanakaei]